MDMEGVATVSVPKAKALKRNGRLRRGCRFSGRGARCTPEVARSLGIRGGKGRKSSGRKKGRRGSMRNLTPKSPQAARNKALFDALMNRRRALKGALKSGSCSSSRTYARDLFEVIRQLSHLPAASREKALKRNKRYESEMRNVTRNIQNVCKGIPAQFQGMGKGGKKSGGHPCASPRPPAWCNKKRKR